MTPEQLTPFQKAMRESLEKNSKKYAANIRNVAFLEGAIENCLKSAMLDFYTDMCEYDKDEAKRNIEKELAKC